VIERGKMYDCPEVSVEKSKDRIDLWFVRQPVGYVTEPVSRVTVANPERLPVYISNGERAIRMPKGPG
jgi:hypothetical protein